MSKPFEMNGKIIEKWWPKIRKSRQIVFQVLGYLSLPVTRCCRYLALYICCMLSIAFCLMITCDHAPFLKLNLTSGMLAPVRQGRPPQIRSPSLYIFQHTCRRGKSFVPPKILCRGHGSLPPPSAIKCPSRENVNFI